MKTKILTLIFTFIVCLSVKAQYQYPDTAIVATTYDTLVIFHPPWTDSCEVTLEGSAMQTSTGHETDYPYLVKNCINTLWHRWEEYYDTTDAYYIITQRYNCFNSEDSIWHYEIFPDSLSKIEYAPGCELKFHVCDIKPVTTSDVYDTSYWTGICDKIITGPSFGLHYNRAYAQRYHFDQPVTLVGVASRVCGSMRSSIYDDNDYFRVLDTNFNELSQSMNYIKFFSFLPYNGVVLLQTSWANWDSGIPMMSYFFADEDGHNLVYKPSLELTDFYLSGDENPDNSYFVDYDGEQVRNTQFQGYKIYPRTCTIYDSVMFDSIYGCQQEPFSPAFQRPDGEWVLFKDDCAYQFYQKDHLGLLPIILKKYDPTAPQSSSLEQAEHKVRVTLYPNPAQDMLNITCSDDMVLVEVCDMLGKKFLSSFPDSKETQLNISSLEKGAYFVTVYNRKDRSTYKIIKE